MKNTCLIFKLVLFFAICIFVNTSSAQNNSESLSQKLITDKKVAELTKTLKNLLDDNRRLSEQLETSEANVVCDEAEVKIEEKIVDISEKKEKRYREDISRLEARNQKLYADLKELAREKGKLEKVIRQFKKELSSGVE